MHAKPVYGEIAHRPHTDRTPAAHRPHAEIENSESNSVGLRDCMLQTCNRACGKAWEKFHFPFFSRAIAIERVAESSADWNASNIPAGGLTYFLENRRFLTMRPHATNMRAREEEKSLQSAGKSEKLQSFYRKPARNYGPDY